MIFSLLAYPGKNLIITIVDGIKYTYTLVKTNGNEFILLGQESTDKLNGTLVKVYYSGNQEKSSLERSIATKVVYFDGLAYSGFTNSLIKHETFWFSKDFKGKQELHINYAGYYYEIPWDHLEMKPISIVAAIPIQIGEILVTPSREEIILDRKTLELIKDRIKKFIDHAKTIVTLEFTDFNSYYDAYRNNRFITDFGLIIPYDELGFKNKITYKPLLPLNIGKIIPDLNWETFGRGRRYTQHNSGYYTFPLYVKNSEFTKRKYIKSYLFDKCVIDLPVLNLNYFQNLLNLSTYPKNQWRSLIKMYIDWFKTQFKVVILSELERTQEFKDYVVNEKKSHKRINNNGIRRKKVDYIARWSSFQKVTWDTHIPINKEFITVTKNTPRDTIEFLYSVISHSDIQLIQAKKEDYKKIESHKIISEVYWSYKINELMNDNFRVFELCELLGIFHNKNIFKNKIIHGYKSVLITHQTFIDKLKVLVDTHNVKVPGETVYNELVRFLDRYEYLKHLGALSTSTYLRKNFQYVHDLIQSKIKIIAELEVKIENKEEQNNLIESLDLVEV